MHFIMNIIPFIGLLTVLNVAVNCDDTLIYNPDKTVEYDNVCPNHRTKCQESQTCCPTKHNSYHCCKYRNADCCPDKYHCCPENSECDAETKRCRRREGFHPLTDMLNEPYEWKLDDTMLKLHPAAIIPMKLEEIKVDFDLKAMCPNNKTQCKDTKTCCVTKKGNYYCCPHKNAVCCPDKYHCCPEGHQCDAKTNQCTSNMFHYKSVPPHRFMETERVDFKPHPVQKFCSDIKHKCSGKKRCCDMDDGKYGCCHFNGGVCCPDLKTCCPHETKCNVKNKTCDAAPIELVPATVPSIITSESKRKPLTIYLSKLGLSTVCPDKSHCPGQSTCCQTGSGGYGCCDSSQATCCADKMTCCPHGTQCKNNGCVKY